jgi:hypothetical protein
MALLQQERFWHIRLLAPPAPKLDTIIGIILGAGDVEIAGLLGFRQMDEDADLKRALFERAGPGSTFADKTLPFLGRRPEVNNLCQFVAARMTMVCLQPPMLSEVVRVGQ